MVLWTVLYLKDGKSMKYLFIIYVFNHFTFVRARLFIPFKVKCLARLLSQVFFSSPSIKHQTLTALNDSSK